MDGRTGNGVYTFVLSPGADYEHKLFKLKIGELVCSKYTVTRVRVGVGWSRCASVRVGSRMLAGVHRELMGRDVMQRSRSLPVSVDTQSH